MIRWAALLALCATAALADPIRSIDITLAPGEDYAAAIDVIRDAGAQATSLSLFWDEDTGEDWPTIANIYYPITGLSLTITFSVIDTVADRRPPDLRALPWDDPRVIAAFADYVQSVLGRMPRVDVLAITIGNEVDVHLQDAASIAEFARFLVAAKAAVARIRPDVPIGTKLTFAGLTQNPGAWAGVLAASDALFLTYYPLQGDFALRPVADVPGDLDRMVALAQGKPVWLLEAGYPSDGCNAAPGGQRDFVVALLSGAVTRPAIVLVSYTYLTDLSDAQVDGYIGYYGIGSDCFRRYLQTLGLRRVDGTAKPALAAFGAAP
jgi:hypothetical protein